MGRPLKPIDGDEVYKLASIGCTQDEIAGFFNTSKSVISSRFRTEFHEGQASSRISLRKRQWNQSKKSVPMSIHLGKNMLGQSDKLDAQVKAVNPTFQSFDDARDPDLPPPAETA